MGHGETKHLHGRNTGFIPGAIGGYTSQMNTSDSWEGFHWGGPFVWGMQEGNGQFHADNVLQHVMDYSEIMIMCGCDTETTNWGFLSQWKTLTAQWLHQLGKKHIFISPELNWYGATSSQRPTVNNQWDKWIPAIPNTEAAMWQAIAYVWITEDTYDKDYLSKYTANWPDDFNKFKDMILGNEDGVPKTPEWAAPLCGVPSRIIKALARDWAKRPTAFLHNNSGAYVRGPYSHEAPRFECFLLAMQAIGKKPGSIMYKTIDEEASHGAIFSTKDEFSFPNPMMIPNQSSVPVGSGGTYVQTISRAYRPYSLLKQPTDWFSNSGVDGMLNVHLAFPGLLDPKKGRGVSNYPGQNGVWIKMVWDAMYNWNSGCAQTGNMQFQAMKTPGLIEFYLIQAIWFENLCPFADIVLPSNTLLEETDNNYTGYEAIISAWYEEQAIAPLGESKSDFEINLAVAQKLDQVMPGYDLEKKLIGDKDGNLLTQDQLLQVGYNKCGFDELNQVGLPTGFPYKTLDWETFKKAQYWLVPYDPNWNKRPLSGVWAAFMANPDDPKNGIDTPSGKIEFYSYQWEKAHPDLPLSSKFYNKTIDKDYDHPPLPHWGVKPYPPYGYWHGDPTVGSEHAWEWYKPEENPRAQVYPIILETGKPKWRQHTMNDGIAWTAEISDNPGGFGAKVAGPDGYRYEPLWINPIDANARGIKDGDIVMVYNERGTILGGARVTERMRPGTVYQEHGSRADPICVPDDPSKLGEYIDRGGATNHIGPQHGNSENARHSGCWTAFLVDIKKADMGELMSKYPDAFKRPYDPAFGLMVKGWVTNWPEK
jgi:anaerobic selenocysteine-containing dehydrogenase